MYAGRAGKVGNTFGDINIPITVHGNAAPGIESSIASAVKTALTENLETILSNLQNDYDLTAI